MNTPITDMVERMLAAGVVHDVIVDAVRTAELQMRPSRGKGENVGRNTGTRIPADWQPSQAGIAFALDRGMARQQIAAEAEKFRNYWSAKSGRDATKRDWEATWRNWCLTALERRHGAAGNNRSQQAIYPTPRSAPTGADAVLAGMGRIAHRIVERRNSAACRDRQMADGLDATDELDFGSGRT